LFGGNLAKQLEPFASASPPPPLPEHPGLAKPIDHPASPQPLMADNLMRPGEDKLFDVFEREEKAADESLFNYHNNWF
jgi:hypothetical protein